MNLEQPETDSTSTIITNILESMIKETHNNNFKSNLTDLSNEIEKYNKKKKEEQLTKKRKEAKKKTKKKEKEEKKNIKKLIKEILKEKDLPEILRKELDTLSKKTEFKSADDISPSLRELRNFATDKLKILIEQHKDKTELLLKINKDDFDVFSDQVPVLNNLIEKNLKNIKELDALLSGISTILWLK